MVTHDTKATGAVLVQGGGIAGVQASLDLANAGFKVYLVERTAAIGGMMSLLDKTFPTGDCATCIVSPKLVECSRNRNIEILTLSEVTAIDGVPGNFTATVLQSPRYVDMDKCIACGACTAKCPARVPDPFNRNLSKRKAAYVTSPQAVPLKYAIDPAHCLYLTKGRCGICADECPTKAIQYDQKPRNLSLKVGAVILAPGFREFQASAKGEFGFGRIANVMTTVQFERMLSSSGPFGGKVVQVSGNREARRIAFIQCVGSRDATCGNDYCSSICCMAATKQALVAREHSPELEITIFYMDIRAHGKEFDAYYQRARETKGINYVRAIPSRVMEIPGQGGLRLRYLGADNALANLDVDLVVLAVGLDPKPDVSPAMAALGIELNEFGFCRTDRLAPLQTSRPGVFVAGVFAEPKDIPETVTQASGAASMAMELLAGARNTLVTQRTWPEEHDVTDEGPRIGVFVCHCGSNIASVVDVAAVAEAAGREPDVVFSTHTMYACSDASLSDVRDAIVKNRLNRVVVASCSPRTHEPLFRDTLREVGINPYLFELANIRDQCSWVHSNTHEAATQKALDLVRMSIARARLLKPLVGEKLAVTREGLVVGGGLSGMVAALSLADQGFPVTLVERERRLGGHLNTITRTLEHEDISGFSGDLVQRVQNHSNIRLHSSTTVTGIAGHVGKFQVRLTGPDGDTQVPCGAVILATGAGAAETSEFSMGRSSRVVTQTQLSRQLHDNQVAPHTRSVVMIQCVGSRSESRPFCSRLCCSMAVMNALALKRRNPETAVYVLYRDIRTYGFRETYYRDARKAGVIFIRYDETHPPVVAGEDDLLVTVDSPDFPEVLEIEADLVALSTGVEPEAGNRDLANLLKLPMNGSGFFMEAHVKLRPVDFASEGFFLCGLAHSPKMMDENIAQARAAASRAATVLSRPFLELDAQVSKVDQNKCISCMTCVHACPYGAPYINMDHKAQIAAAKCMGCGICASECPARAIQLSHFESSQFAMMLDELLTLRN
ncbi:MAG: FAD-dependent oxidoreductase [Pseudomonadota bacterium]